MARKNLNETYGPSQGSQAGMSSERSKRHLFSDFLRLRVIRPRSVKDQLPITSDKDSIAERVLDCVEGHTASQLANLRTLAQDRQSQYNAYDEMATDSVIAAALEVYADDATQTDEKGRVIWVESEDSTIADAGNRLLDLLEIPERAWKHIYMACKYGDYYLKLNRPKHNEQGEIEDSDIADYIEYTKGGTVKIVNDKEVYKGVQYKPSYEEYVEDVPDPASVFDLQRHGKTAGYIQVQNDVAEQQNRFLTLTHTFKSNEITIIPNDALVHIALSETLSRVPETVTLNYRKQSDDGSENGEDVSITYTVKRGKSILYDVYPIQKQVQLLQDALSLNRLTRSSLLRLLQIDVSDMPRKEVNPYLRRVKNLIEQHIAMNKNNGAYQSYQAPGPVENILYFPISNGKGSISIQNLGGDVNVKDIADLEYFNNQRYGALKIPKAYLGQDMEGTGLGNGGSLTKLSQRYARTVRRIQLAYIRAITTMLNLFFIDKGLDYVNKFEVKMTSPNTQEDLDRNSLIKSNTEIVDGIMKMLDSLDGEVQKEALVSMITDILKMPYLADIITKDKTPSEDIDIGSSGLKGPSTSEFVGQSEDNVEANLADAFTSEPSSTEPAETTTSTSETASEISASASGSSGSLTANDFAQFEDTIG